MYRPESEGETADERKQSDLDKVTNLVSKVTDVTKGDFSNPIRLGAWQVGKGIKPRMLKVAVKSEEVKRRVLSNAPKLNDGVREAKDRVYINQDRTERERNDFRKLREELERRKKDEPELVIRGGKIVKGKKREGEDSKKADQKDSH
jgi:hypothetical protein